MKIGEVEKLTGLTAKAIRLYEEKGLIDVPRKDNLYRDYDEDVVDKLKFIQSLRNIGVPLSEICLHFNGVITFEELLNNQKEKMEKENLFHRESYEKCIDYIDKLQPKNFENYALPRVVKKCNALLGIDIGTTNISAVVVDYAEKKILETYTVANNFRIQTSNDDFFEFDADRIFEKIKCIIDYLIKIYPNIKCMGITGQMHGFVYVSSEGKAVSHFYNWQDKRGNRKYSENKTYCDEITERTGYVCSSGFAFATMFYNLINRIEPRNAESFCGIADYVVMMLVGAKMPLVHSSNAASFGMFDIKNNCFDKAAIEKLGLLRYKLPLISKENNIAGSYNNIPVCVAIGDNQASFFGSVKYEDVSALANYGTGSQISVVSNKYVTPNDELEIRPYLFNKYLICGSALCGGKAYAVIEKFFSEYAEALTQKCDSQYETMNAFAKKAYSSGKALQVSTLFCGTRKEPFPKGGIKGIDDVNFTPGNLILGVLQGMTDELKKYFDCMEHGKIKYLVASGNAVKKNSVLQCLLKDTFDADVILTSNNEEAAFGSALFAGVSCSFFEVADAKNMIKSKSESFYSN